MYLSAQQAVVRGAKRHGVRLKVRNNNYECCMKNISSDFFLYIIIFIFQIHFGTCRVGYHIYCRLSQNTYMALPVGQVTKECMYGTYMSRELRQDKLPKSTCILPESTGREVTKQYMYGRLPESKGMTGYKEYMYGRLPESTDRVGYQRVFVRQVTREHRQGRLPESSVRAGYQRVYVWQVNREDRLPKTICMTGYPEGQDTSSLQQLMSGRNILCSLLMVLCYSCSCT